MMDKLWVVLLVALTGAHFGQGLPLRSTPQSYPHNTNGPLLEGWKESGLYVAVPALALIVTAVGLLFGCTWCYRHKDCKQNEGADNQLFTASATHLHERRSHPPDSGFSEPANNNISEDNNNGPISLREMQNIANNNAAAYIVSENEERNRVSRESLVEFEPLPTGIRVADPLERCVDWFGDEDFPRNRLQYLREIGRGWFGRVVEGEIEDEGITTTVAVKILNPSASLEDKARFLDEARIYRDASHENVLAFVASCLQEDPWILIFELCSTDLQSYLTANRSNMAALDESGVPLRLMCDITSALSYLHTRGYTYGELCTRNVLVRGEADAARAVLGHYGLEPAPADTAEDDVWALGGVLRDVSTWGAAPAPPPDCPYRDHLWQVLQLCWSPEPAARPSAAQVLALLAHLREAQAYKNHADDYGDHGDHGDHGYGSSDFEERWQRLKPNTIPKLDEHQAQVHHASTSRDAFPDFPRLAVDVDAAVSRSSSIMSDRDPLPVQIKSESLTNLHGSLEDVRNIYLRHDEQAALECHQGNTLEERDRSDASVDPWLKDIIAGSQDDVSYYKDVSDVIKNLDNILNSEKTSSSESSHQASPSRDNLSLDCKKDYPMQSTMVKSPGISNFQNILEDGITDESPEKKQDDEEDRDTVGTLSHSFERHCDTISQQTLENLTPNTPIKDMELPCDEKTNVDLRNIPHTVVECEGVQVDAVLPKESNINNSDSVVTDLCIAKNVSEDCQTSSDSKLTDIVSDKETVEAKSISKLNDNHPVTESVEEIFTKSVQSLEQKVPVNVQNKEILPVYPEIVENNEIAHFLPIAPQEQRPGDLGIEITSINSQNDINNDLITPAKSTTDSEITPVDMVVLEDSKVEQLDNVSQIVPEPPNVIEMVIEETKQSDLPLPSHETKEESLPECVLTGTVGATTPVVSDTLSKTNIKTDVEIVAESITQSKASASTSTEEEILSFPETAFSETNMRTPTLLLSEVQDDIQIFNRTDIVPEEFVEKIIKEAETAALSSIEAHNKVLVPEPFNIANAETIDIFLGNEIKALKNSSSNMASSNSGMLPDIIEEPFEKEALSNFLKEDVKIPDDTSLDNIAKEILLDAIQDVPNAMEKVKSSDFFDEDVADIDHQTSRNSEMFTPNVIPVRESLLIQSVINFTNHGILDKLDDSVEVTYTEIDTQSVVPQGSLDLESTASVDTSQTTLLIKESLKEETMPILEISKETLADDPVHDVVEPVGESLLVQSVINTKNHGILDKLDDIEVTYIETETQSVVPQGSLDLESTASADTSQSTFHIKETLKEESIPVRWILEEEETLLVDPVHDVLELKECADAKLNTFLESEKVVGEKVTFNEKIPKSLSDLPRTIEESNLNTNSIEENTEKESVKEQDTLPRFDNFIVENGTTQKFYNSTSYMDLTDSTNSQIIEQHPMEDNVRVVIMSCLETTGNESCSLIKNESTVYLDLPNVIRLTDDFLHSERQLSSQVDEKDPLCSSTPKSSVDDTLNSTEEKSNRLSETKVPDCSPGVTLTKLEQQCVQDILSPFDSPSKSHPTDTYDENSSVVLGPFENCTVESLKTVKSCADLDIPKEEVLAFSSNFSEMNLETPSPLRDGNFLNEVPDIVHDDIQFDDITSEPKEEVDPKTDISDPADESVTEKKVSPSTPPNSPGYFLASTSQQKHLVEIDLNQPTEPAPIESDSGLSSLHKEIELNQIDLQITSKLAMAENENNLNIEYSGPLTVEGLVQNGLVREEESAPETFLAGNSSNIEDVREMFTLDEDCVNALRNELELKLPLAQVAAIEPACENDSESDGENAWALPPPPELVLSYPGALSPIAEETGPQLSAYESDLIWNASIRTDSSESYPEPCDNSTDEHTSLPSATGTGRSPAHRTYTLQPPSSREITMSVDSLNASPAKEGMDDRTFTVDDDRGCERLSQVSPFVLSPTDTAPDQSDVTGVSTLSKTTLPTDANVSKPETQLSKATSIDSWCSNDTLYNVEEAFDDLASDPDLPVGFDDDKEQDNSESSHTLTVNDDKELSHVSTYIVHDNRSDDDRFSPDSITADNDNYTYTKVKTEAVTSPTKSETNETQTKDLAYGTLMSGAYSNCTTEMLSADNAWMLPHPELVRRSPIDGNVDVSALSPSEHKIEPEDSPRLEREPCIKKMDSVEISCLGYDMSTHESPNRSNHTEIHESPNYHHDMASGVTSTPLTEMPPEESVEPSVSLAEEMRTPELNNIPNYQSFLYSVELRHQATPHVPSGSQSEVEQHSSRCGADFTPSFMEFMQAATLKPQEMSRLQSSQIGSDNSSDFGRFESSAKFRPQDLFANVSQEEGPSSKEHFIRPSQPSQEPRVVLSPPSITNFNESHVGKVDTVIITDLEEDETEQPHSIIIAEVSKDKDNSSKTFDSHISSELNLTYDSHSGRRLNDAMIRESNSDNSRELTVNGVNDDSHDFDKPSKAKSPETKTEEPQKEQSVNNVDSLKEVPNGVSNLVHINNEYDIKCNGKSENFATVSFLSEPFEELLESNVDDGDCKDVKNDEDVDVSEDDKTLTLKDTLITTAPENQEPNVNGVEEKISAVTEDFLQNEKKFCQLDVYLPLLSDIRFTGPASEIMSTSFTQESPTDPAPERDKPADVKDWDSDTDSHSSNSSSGEFIWKGGDGQETSVVPSTQFDHRGSNGSAGENRADAPASGSGSGSGSGSEGDEVEFVPSSWDCRAAPAKSSLRSLRHVQQDNKKRVVFKRQKYHCVYEYPRELPVDADSPAYLPDLSTYTEWDPRSAEEAELGYGQLFGAPSPLDLYPLRGTVAFGTDYDEDFFISSSARPFESLGVMSSTSQFFPGLHLKPPPAPLAALPPDRSPPSPSPSPITPPAPLAHTKTPSLDFTTPDSGVEDITPGSTEDDFKTKLSESEVNQWRSGDSASSSESVSPSSPGGEALGGLRHTRDKLKLDLPPSPHVPSPRHNRVFNFVLDKPKRRVQDDRPTEIDTPLVMTDETPIVSGSLPLPDVEDPPVPEPTFSTFGKTVPRSDPEQKIILTDEADKPASPPARDTALDSGDEDSGIESSSKATLERTKTNVS